jgi:hypothetical protein
VSRMPICLLMLLVSCLHVSAVSAGGIDRSGPTPPSEDEKWVTWHGDNYFSSCNNNCAVSFLAGPQVKTHMADIFIKDPSPVWDWKYGNSAVLSIPFSRRLLTIWKVIDIEPEAGLAKRVGDMHAVEAWAAVYFRWTRFPWDNHLRTSIAVSAGVSYAAGLPSGSNHAKFLNYFSPEITFAPPEYPQHELVFRFHHRSNLGVSKGKDPGWQYITAGLRTKF